MHIRHFFYLSKADRKAFALLLAVLAIIVVVRTCFYEDTESVAESGEAEQQATAQFAEKLRQDSLKRFARRDARKKEAELRVEQFPFDPNTADSLTLRRLGLKPWQIGNMMKYRRKGGHWKSPDDFARLYGLSEEDFLRLRPYIRVEKKPLASQENSDFRRERPKDSLPLFRYAAVQKFRRDTLLNLNTTDTVELKRIPGIGSYYAKKICGYRERLGGFVSADQLQEIEGLPEDIVRWFVVDSLRPVTRLNVNTAAFRTLARHPYLTYEQVKVIDAYRKRHGKITSWSDLMLSDEFRQIDEAKLAPYFCFE